ncbi:MAG: L-glutamate gamma-semialdehyde dehydrogenase [Pseudomonadota bacterium]
MAHLQNHPVRSFAPGAPERASLSAELQRQRDEPRTIRPVVGGREIDAGHPVDMFEPHAHHRSLGLFQSAGTREAEQAIAAAMRARDDWSRMGLASRQTIFLRAAELLGGPFNDQLLAATMLQQSKTAYQAEIDASCELIDFLRFNVAYANELQAFEPLSVDTERNRMELRPLDGFVFAASPFNFTAIAGNLCVAPALMGNTIVWKPSERSIYSAAFLMDLFEAAGLPPGVINMLPSDAPAEIGAAVMQHPDLAGVHFTGSTSTFNRLWATVGASIDSYRSYPRIVGETGGKNFVIAHASANVEALITALVRGAFDYQGQKCSAASRAYIPANLYKEVCERLAAAVEEISYGDITDFSHFMGAVIDERAFDTIASYLDYANSASEHRKIAGEAPSRSNGYFIPPTVFECMDPRSSLMVEEIFGPVLAIHPYDENDLDGVVDLAMTTTPFALTGAIFAQDQSIIDRLTAQLRDAAGNFYVNDKPTGAVVGRQPFGGSRKSGTNDKAGSPYNLLRWTSPRSVKENLLPPTEPGYPHMTSS